MRQERGIDFAKITGKKAILFWSVSYDVVVVACFAYLCDQFALLELSADKRHIAMLVQFRAAHFQFVCRSHYTSQTTTKSRRAGGVIRWWGWGLQLRQLPHLPSIEEVPSIVGACCRKRAMSEAVGTL